MMPEVEGGWGLSSRSKEGENLLPIETSPDVKGDSAPRALSTLKLSTETDTQLVLPC
jgi:hypothetical protein